MILPTDVPTRAQVERLLAAREPSSVSIYLPTSPASRGDAERIELKNLAAEAARQLGESGTARADGPPSRRSWPTSSTTTSSGATRHAVWRSS